MEAMAPLIRRPFCRLAAVSNLQPCRTSQIPLPRKLELRPHPEGLVSLLGQALLMVHGHRKSVYWRVCDCSARRLSNSAMHRSGILDMSALSPFSNPEERILYNLLAGLIGHESWSHILGGDISGGDHLDGHRDCPLCPYQGHHYTIPASNECRSSGSMKNRKSP